MTWGIAGPGHGLTDWAVMHLGRAGYDLSDPRRLPHPTWSLTQLQGCSWLVGNRHSAAQTPFEEWQAGLKL